MKEFLTTGLIVLGGLGFVVLLVMGATYSSVGYTSDFAAPFSK